MGYTVEPVNPFMRGNSPKMMCVDVWDNSCVVELNKNFGIYQMVQFYRNIPRGYFDSINNEVSLKISVVGKEISDISGIADTACTIEHLTIGMIDKRAIECAPISKMKGVQSVKVSYLDGIQMQGIAGSSVNDLAIKEVGKLRGILDFSGLLKLRNFSVSKIGIASGINLSSSSDLQHIALMNGKRLEKLIFSDGLKKIQYLHLEKIPLATAECFACYKPTQVDLRVNDIFRNKVVAEECFSGSTIIWTK